MRRCDTLCDQIWSWYLVHELVGGASPLVEAGAEHGASEDASQIVINIKSVKKYGKSTALDFTNLMRHGYY